MKNLYLKKVVCFVATVNVDANILSLPMETITGTIVSVDIKSLTLRLKCPKCTKEVEADNGIVMCETCQTMSMVEDCPVNSQIMFSLLNSATKVRQTTT